MSRRILLNSARCLNCQTRLVSKYLGDYRNCSCGELGINGGLTQIIRTHTHPSRGWVELSVFEEVPGDDAGSRGEAGDRVVADDAGVHGDGDGGDGRSEASDPRPARRRPSDPRKAQ